VARLCPDLLDELKHSSRFPSVRIKRGKRIKEGKGERKGEALQCTEFS